MNYCSRSHLLDDVSLAPDVGIIIIQLVLKKNPNKSKDVKLHGFCAQLTSQFF